MANTDCRYVHRESRIDTNVLRLLVDASSGAAAGETRMELVGEESAQLTTEQVISSYSK